MKKAGKDDQIPGIHISMIKNVPWVSVRSNNYSSRKQSRKIPKTIPSMSNNTALNYFSGTNVGFSNDEMDVISSSLRDDSHNFAKLIRSPSQLQRLQEKQKELENYQKIIQAPRSRNSASDSDSDDPIFTPRIDIYDNEDDSAEADQNNLGMNQSNVSFPTRITASNRTTSSPITPHLSANIRNSSSLSSDSYHKTILSQQVSPMPSSLNTIYDVSYGEIKDHVWVWCHDSNSSDQLQNLLFNNELFNKKVNQIKNFINNIKNK